MSLAGEIKVHCSHSDIVKVSELKSNPKNPNKHPESQIEILANIIEKQGWRQPIKVSTLSGYIVSGHGRYEAALFMGAEYVPVDYQEYESEEQELSDLLADNRIAELAEMDEKMLAEIFQGINADVLELAGYEEDFLQDLIDAVNEDEEISGSVPFSEELREEHNYIVLYFDNEVDWLQAESLFNIQTVKSFSTRKDGKINEKTERRGVGRVLNGAKALEEIRNVYNCELPVI